MPHLTSHDGHKAASPQPVTLGGVTPFSATDWPGQLVAVFFLQGCPLRCGYCHNLHLLEYGPGALEFSSALDGLMSRRGLLDGIVLSGGEPCAQAGLPAAARAIRERGFKVGLHTAGIFPEGLRRALPLLDWVGLDVKAPQQQFAAVTGHTAWRRVEQSLDLLLAAGGEFEVRTTWHPSLFPASDLFDLAQYLARRGVRQYAVQRMRSLPGGAAAEPGCDATRWVTGPAPEAAVLAGMAQLFSRFTLR